MYPGDSLTLAGFAALFAVMAAGALVPGVSAITVAARSAAHGFGHGVATTLGIVAGDIVFIVIAVYGLAILADLLGRDFVFVRYLGAAWLCWLGFRLWRAPPAAAVEAQESSLAASFLVGLLITLGDQKAILFYLGLLPAFMDVAHVTPLETGLLALLAFLTVGGAKLLYALAGHRAGRGNAGAERVLNRIAGSVLIAVGVVMTLQA